MHQGRIGKGKQSPIMDISGSVSALREKRKGNMDRGMNFKQRIVLIVMDILILIELMFSIYLGYRSQENITVIFLKTYIPAVIVTIIIGRVFIKRLRSQEVNG